MKKSIIFITILFSFTINSAPKVKVMPIPGNINTAMQEFSPSLTADGKTMYFYSKRSNTHTDLFKSVLTNGKWSTPVELKSLNSPYDDQSPYISDDEKYLIFSSNRDGSIEFRLSNGKIAVSRDLYYSENKNGRWTKPASLSDKINTEEMEENPFMHGNDFYFTRYPFGDTSRARIFKTVITGNELLDPEPLPYPINDDSSSNIAAVISMDGKYIYFSSDRSGGYGGYDIYRSTINGDGTYGDPENLGPEINTEGNEAYLVISKANNALYFCRKKKNESYDIYTAVAEEEQFAETVEPEKDPEIAAPPQKPPGEDVTKNLKETKKLTLNSVRFEVNSSELLPESLQILDHIVYFLKTNPEIKLKVTGHTDLTGDVELNKALSQDRAEAVRNYLVSKGVKKDRLQAEGKGSTEPLINDTEPESNKKNRRTEFQVID